MHVLTCLLSHSPTRTTMQPLTGNFLKNIDETEFGNDIKLRSNGSKHAIPNPYSTSEARSTCGCVVVMF